MCRLEMPDAPCLEAGSGSRRIALPMELCTIAPGQRHLRLTPDQTATMIRTAAAPPSERERFITETVGQTAGFGNDPQLREFGVRVEPRMIEVNWFSRTLTRIS